MTTINVRGLGVFEVVHIGDHYATLRNVSTGRTATVSSGLVKLKLAIENNEEKAK